MQVHHVPVPAYLLAMDMGVVVAARKPTWEGRADREATAAAIEPQQSHDITAISTVV